MTPASTKICPLNILYRHPWNIEIGPVKAGPSNLNIWLRIALSVQILPATRQILTPASALDAVLHLIQAFR